jgi:hypothetical protein
MDGFSAPCNVYFHQAAFSGHAQQKVLAIQQAATDGTALPAEREYHDQTQHSGKGYQMCHYCIPPQHTAK